MKDPMLPLPNVGDWANLTGAAMMLGRTKRTVKRMVIDRKIAAYRPYGATERLDDHLFWVPELREVSAALRRLRDRRGQYDRTASKATDG